MVEGKKSRKLVTIDIIWLILCFSLSSFHFNGVEMNDDADAAVEHDKENAISHQMKIPHHPQGWQKIKWPLLKAHAKWVMPYLFIFLGHTLTQLHNNKTTAFFGADRKMFSLWLVKIGFHPLIDCKINEFYRNNRWSIFFSLGFLFSLEMNSEVRIRFVKIVQLQPSWISHLEHYDNIENEREKRKKNEWWIGE